MVPPRIARKILAVISSCGGGDWPPLLSVAKDLSECGHEIRVVCDSRCVSAVESAKLIPVCLPDKLMLSGFFDSAIKKLLKTGGTIDATTANPLQIWAESCSQYIEKKLSYWKPDLVLGSLLALEFSCKLSDRYRAKLCFINPGCYFGDARLPPKKEDFSPLGFQMYQHWLLPPANKSDLILHCTDPFFDPVVSPLPENHKVIGPRFWEYDSPIPSFIKEPGAPWILFSTSTAPQAGEDELLKMALEALAAFDVRVLVTLPEGEGVEIANDANVFITGYLPHSKVLPHCRLVLCHGGHGLVMKSIYCGTPMVLVPWGRDQPGVSRRAENLGVASVVGINECNVKRLTLAIEAALQNKKMSDTVHAHSNRLKNIPERLAISAIEALFA